MRNSILLLLIISILFTNCSTDSKNDTSKSDNSKQELQLQEKSVIKTNVEKNEKAFDNKLYELILSDDTLNNNLIVFIDPHGDGKFVYNKIKDDSKNIGSNIICLKNVENNIPNYLDLISGDINDYKKQTNKKVDKLYLVGFSGGARMVFQYSLKNNVSGVVMCGAGIGNMVNNPLTFPIVFIAGTADFNYNEQYYSPFSEIAKNKNILGLTFNGKHEWPNNDLLLLSINFLESKNGVDISKNISYIDMMNDYNEYRKHNEQYMAFKQIETINKIFSNNDTKNEFNNFISSQSFKDFAKKLEISLQVEFDRNNGLAGALPEQDWKWWENKINEIDELIKTSKDNLEINSYKRTRAYLGVVMYSVVNNEIKKYDSKNIEKYLKIYEKLEPDNEDMKKFKEIFLYQHSA